MKRAFLFSLLLGCAPLWAEDIRSSILENPRSPFYVDFAHYPKADRSLPVGVFDSGTGGLTVLNAMVGYDEHQNNSGAPGADGVPDFQTEDFIYLADQANMPYGNYPGVGKTDLLVEHVLKCAQFLLGNRYYTAAAELRQDKKPVKTIVIACNTATAYGKDEIERLLQRGKSDLKVIGVIDAGARGALSKFHRDESGSIGIFATAGTVASGGYTRAIERLRRDGGYRGTIQTYSQGGVGLAEAIDEESSFIDRKAQQPRQLYKGPKLTPQEAQAFGLDASGNGLLCDSQCAQLNSAPNYVRYHLVSLLDKMKADPQARPLKALILGCTHYPYMSKEIAAVLDDLRAQPQYRHLLAPEVALIDPALNTSRELYDHLHASKLDNPRGSLQNAEFYISVPDPQTEPQHLEAGGTRFTYQFKYDRQAGSERQFVHAVPFDRVNLGSDVIERLRSQIPQVFSLIQNFDRQSSKTAYLKDDRRL